MIEDRSLIRKFKLGNESAFRCIYEKYKNYLLTVATALLSDIEAAEDIVHSVFIAFAESINDFELNGSLKRYLAICVANRARNLNKTKQPSKLSHYERVDCVSDTEEPERSVMLSEELQRINDAISLLPYDQREVLILRLKGGMRFKEIANLQKESINTVQSRYRYGLNKLRSLLDDENMSQ
jgi:RNA polymerase sigma-70 factor (ECF subfamily)